MMIDFQDQSPVMGEVTSFVPPVPVNEPVQPQNIREQVYIKGTGGRSLTVQGSADSDD